MEQGEKFNTWTHFAGALFALAGSVVLITMGVASGDAWKIASFAIYGATLVLLYSFSTLYHNAAHGKLKLFFQKLDHNAIYLLIAGSYTPFSLVSLRGAWGWSLFGVVWGLALLGMMQEIWRPFKTRIVSLLIYVVMGWVAIIALVPLVQVLSWNGFSLVAAGGVVYTLGIIFYLNDERFPHWHGIWHLFVLTGSILHFCAIILYVA